MANINLLPWRQELRKEKQQQFISIIAVVAAIAAGLVWMVSSYYDSELSNQRGRNSFLSQEISKLDKKIVEINELTATREQLIERMELIQNLQGNRPVIVRLFDELARSVPEDLYYTSLSIQGSRVNVKGVAKSNNRVAALMRNFDESEWFADPALLGVKAVANGSNVFEVSVRRVEPQSSEEP
ncbi:MULTISPECIES: PilN domain-containing protein [unclassified Oceanobacter]|uniref:PilN domain-containing protein n=1 Tax=unclassified Oceanobacter TaxID=2620260 RepID=UPI0026E3989E|nr:MULTISPECIES: PilN domain-containing protein [unclassified Oceanobacter]MDO6682855.1 PilN domain-containing protein [Oceanobacter sp. 5_MG-2023]MDP2505614.1 PilN domain-containing protein [Oceanobacter sp. 3_MG-2023]MDP2547196.1 PilN domain-containing protein [Oceanobacter sp. 4_MG-2023]